jgi:hypothetical protein
MEGMMRVQDVPEDLRRLVHEIGRAVDRKLEIQLADSSGPDDRRIALRLVHGTRHRRIELAVDDLRRALTERVDRESVRQRIKRGHDAMWMPTGPVRLVSTKFERPAQAPMPQRRPPMRGRSGPRR